MGCEAEWGMGQWDNKGAVRLGTVRNNGPHFSPPVHHVPTLPLPHSRAPSLQSPRPFLMSFSEEKHYTRSS